MLNNYSKKLTIRIGTKIKVKTLKKHAPLKTKVTRENHKSFITKNLRKEIMKRSALKNRAIISNNPKVIELYKK